MRKLGHRARRAAAVLSTAMGVYTVVAACGPQAVPVPTRLGPFFPDDGATSAPPPSGGQTNFPAMAGRSPVPAAGSGSVRDAGPAAEGGRPAPPAAGIGLP